MNNTLILKTTYKDNLRFLSEDYVSYLEGLEEIDERYYKIYVKGEFGSAGGLVYDKNFQIVESYPYTAQKSDSIFYGIDFGYKAPTSVVKITEDRNEDLYFVEELLYSSNLTNQELIEFLLHNCKRHHPIYCDSAEPDRIKEIKNKGLFAKPANKSISAGISFVKGLNKKIRILSNSKNLLSELYDLPYKKDKKTNEYTDEIDPSYPDHAADAMRYGFYSHLSKASDISLK